MKPVWIIEDFLEDRSVQYLQDEIKAQGMDCIVWNVRQFMDMNKEIEQENRKYPGEQCIIFLGSIGMVQNIQRYSKWIPGAWSNFKELECQSYYVHLGKYLLNQDYCMMPIGGLKDRIDWCFEIFGQEDTIFIRPNSNAKSFSGQQLHLEKLGTDLQWIIDPTFSNPNDLCVISSPKNIEAEYRFITADKEVITGSLYKTKGILSVHPSTPKEAWDLANEIAKIPYTTDRMGVIDICKTPNGKYHLLEVGGFSCAGLYACDQAEIVKHAARIALEEFNEYHGT